MHADPTFVWLALLKQAYILLRRLPRCSLIRLESKRQRASVLAFEPLTQTQHPPTHTHAQARGKADVSVQAYTVRGCCYLFTSVLSLKLDGSPTRNVFHKASS